MQGQQLKHYFDEMEKTTKKFVWWHNGVIEKHSIECPGPGFVIGRKDSTRKKMSESKLELFNDPVKGKAFKKVLSDRKKGLLWWTNGKTTLRSKECPGEGFVRGRIPWKRNKKR